MNLFQKRVAVRIGAVSVVLAGVFSVVAWYAEIERVESGIVALAIEESEKLLKHFDSVRLDSPAAAQRAELAAETIIGGLFDIAEIYDVSGVKLAEAMTAHGAGMEMDLPDHGPPSYSKASYETLIRPGDIWILRVFVPIRESAAGAVTGYFEGVRLVPDWQRDQIRSSALTVALLVSFAALLCGAVIYPIVVHLSRDNETKACEILGSHIAMMESLGRAIAKRDSDTGDHNYRVAWIAARIAEEMGLSDGAMKSLIVGSFLHDVGKIGIPDAILLKPGKLDADEFDIMRTHVIQGEEIVQGIGWLDGAHDVVSAHHEKWNGTGYPRGLEGNAIPIAARIFAVADVFDALCSKRPYKEPMPFETAMGILEADTGTHFDPTVMQTFRRIAPDLRTRLGGGGERHVRSLLEDLIERYFAI
jgi:HD-GYP domain-containing protein (c-di-GMP phosphodiesterase class II)